jgi:hypothetical protein
MNQINIFIKQILKTSTHILLLIYIMINNEINECNNIIQQINFKFLIIKHVIKHK